MSEEGTIKPEPDPNHPWYVAERLWAEEMELKPWFDSIGYYNDLISLIAKAIRLEREKVSDCPNPKPPLCSG